MSEKRFYSKSEVNGILRQYGLGSIKSDKPKNGFDFYPFKDFNGKIVHGISLFRTSPVTFTDTGLEGGKEKVREIIKALRPIAMRIDTVSDLEFVAYFRLNQSQVFKLIATKNERNGLVYDQTFHFLTFEKVNLSMKKYKEENNEFKNKDFDYKQELSNEHLDKVLGNE